MQIKLAFVPGLKKIVLIELEKLSGFSVVREGSDSIYLDFHAGLGLLKSLKSVSRIYLVSTDQRYNPTYLSNHKSILGDLIALVISSNSPKSFKTFNVSCSGKTSTEVIEINKYLETTFGLDESVEADLKIHIAKIEDTWEVGVQITPRPLSLRDYKVKNMSGAMDPTVAYALNSLCVAAEAHTYLNVFSGSATLLIEAAQSHSNLKTLLGFDNDKKHLSLAMQNIKKAGLVRQIELKEADIFRTPDFGKFDVITADLPFGMVIAKGENLEDLYRVFVDYVETSLNKKGQLGVYTSEFKLFEKIVSRSQLKVVDEIKVDLLTAEKIFLPTKIIILKFK